MAGLNVSHVLLKGTFPFSHKPKLYGSGSAKQKIPVNTQETTKAVLSCRQRVELNAPIANTTTNTVGKQVIVATKRLNDIPPLRNVTASRGPSAMKSLDASKAPPSSLPANSSAEPIPVRYNSSRVCC